MAIAWDSHPDSNHPPTNDTLESDLDLYILDPNGNTVGMSTTYDNSYELVEFNPETTGTFKAKVRAARFDDVYEYLGYAVASSCVVGDLNHDGQIDFDDFTMFADAYGTRIGDPKYNPEADFDHDGDVDFDDFVYFSSVYGTHC